MKPQLSHRKCTLEDLPALIQCASECFFITHVRLGVPEKDIKDYITQNYAYDVLKDEILDPNCHFEIVIDDDIYTKSNKDRSLDEPQSNNYVVGYTKLTWGEAQTVKDFRQKPYQLQLQRLYVLPSHQNYKLGTFLQNWVVKFATESKLGFNNIWLTTHWNNKGAIQFYLRHGFAITGEYYFGMSDTANLNHIMERPILRAKL